MQKTKNLEIHAKNGKTDIYLDGVSIADKCLSCSVDIVGGEQPKATLTMLCDVLDVQADGADVTTEVPPLVDSHGFYSADYNQIIVFFNKSEFEKIMSVNPQMTAIIQDDGHRVYIAGIKAAAS